MSDKLKRFVRPEWRPYVKHLRWEFGISHNPHPQVQELYLEWCRQQDVFQIQWNDLAVNPHPKAVKLCLDAIENDEEDNLNDYVEDDDHHTSRPLRERGDWLRSRFCRNPNPVATQIGLTWAKDHLDQVQWGLMCDNCNDEALDFYLKYHPGEICWSVLCANSNSRAVHLCMEKAKTHPECIPLEQLWKNSNMQVLDFFLEQLRHSDVFYLTSCRGPEAVEKCWDIWKSRGWRIHSGKSGIPFQKLDWESVLANPDSGKLNRVLKIVERDTNIYRHFLVLSRNPGIFLPLSKLCIMHIWTTQPPNVLYRIPLDLIHVIADFV